MGRATKRKFLGYTMYRRKEVVHLKIAPIVVARFKGDLRQVFRRGRGRALRRVIEGTEPQTAWLDGVLPHTGSE